MKLMRYNDISESYSDDGGITYSQFDEIKNYVERLKERSKNGIITNEDRVLSEILYSIVKEKDKLDFKTYYLRRLDNLRNSKNGRKRGVEKVEFRDLVWWLQSIYEWSFVETEGAEKVRFDWNGGGNSFWLNSDSTIKGFIPEDLREKIMQKGIKIEN